MNTHQVSVYWSKVYNLGTDALQALLVSAYLCHCKVAMEHEKSIHKYALVLGSKETKHGEIVIENCCLQIILAESRPSNSLE